MLSGCCVNPFRFTPRAAREGAGRPGTSEAEATRSLAPAHPAVQARPGSQPSDPEAGFDIRLVIVQPGVHLNTEQPCDVVFSSRPEGIDPGRRRPYPIEAAQRIAVKCHAPSGQGWVDLLLPSSLSRRVSEIGRGRRLRIRILAAEGGYFDYPIAELVAIEHRNPRLAEDARPGPIALPNGFDLRSLASHPGRVGTTQSCAVSLAGDIDLIQPTDRQSRNYPAGVQNRMTVRCKHAGGEENADLLFMPAQALAALRVRRGAVVPVRILAKSGGYVDYPILLFAGQ